MTWVTRFARRIGVHNFQPIKYTADLSLWVLAAPLAFILRLDKDYSGYAQDIIVYTLVSAAVKAGVILLFSLHRQSWHRVGTRDLYTLLQATGSAALALLAIGFIINPLPIITHGMPRSVPFLEGGIALLLLGGARLLLRLLHEQSLMRQTGLPRRRILIVGAGEAGMMVARELLRRPDADMRPVGFLDDDPAKRRMRYMGVPVLGTVKDLPALVRRFAIDEVLIAMPSAQGDVIRSVVELSRRAQVRHRIFPGVFDILSERVSINQIRNVDVEDLLRRAPIRLDLNEIARYIEDRVVFVSGAGGSIGSEIVRQVASFNPRHIVLVDRDENGLYLFEQELCESKTQAPFTTIVADIQRQDKLVRIFTQYWPEVVFHAAAHKHVPFMEENPDEAILNNVKGTAIMLDVALANGAKRFVNISTDKAIRPASVMGASKRVAEYLVMQAALRAKPGQAFVSVRFGNVLGSRGSVIPIFKEQIHRGGPVRITHPDMARYFMSITEATQLVLQAASLGDNGAVYILDMGDPVRIVDLACELIRLSGLEPYSDVGIEYTGLRPGEKLSEELYSTDEEILPTRYDKIMLVRPNGLPENLSSQIPRLLEAARAGKTEEMEKILKQIVPFYQTPDLPS